MDPGRTRPTAKRPVNQPRYQWNRLRNGLRLATVEMPHMQSACVGLWAHVGGRHESRRLSGISHFLEHMLFKGTPRLTPRQISASVEGVGGYLNAFTSEDATCYYAKAGVTHLRRLLDVLLDIYTRSLFDPTEVERERQVIREEISMYRDQPCQRVQELLSLRLWPGNALGRPLTGTMESLAAISRDAIADYCQRWYNLSTTTLAVASPLPHQAVAQLVEALAPALPTGRRPRITPVRPCGPPLPLAESDDIEQSHLAIGFETFGRHDKRRYALKLLSVVLGENMSSRLFQELRESRGYCYSVSSCTSLFEEVGMLNISLGLDADNLQKATTVLCRELRRLREKPVPASELGRAKDYVIGQNLLGLESTTNQMMWIGESMVGYGTIIAPDEVRARMASVTAAEVQSAAETLLRNQRLAVTMVGPDDRLPDYHRLLS